jgi:hypothetical protein
VKVLLSTASVSMSPSNGMKSGIAASVRCAHSICMKWMKIAPKTSGQSEPSPPTTTPTRRSRANMAGTELRPRTGEASTRQRLLIPAFVHLRPSPTRFLQPSFTGPAPSPFARIDVPIPEQPQ